MLKLLADFWAAYISAWKQSFNYSGKATRPEYWWFAIAYAPYAVLLQYLNFNIGHLGPSAPVLFLIFLLELILLASVVPSVSLLIRRVRDTGFSPWWTMGTFVLGIGSLIPQDSTDANPWLLLPILPSLIIHVFVTALTLSPSSSADADPTLNEVAEAERARRAGRRVGKGISKVLPPT